MEMFKLFLIVTAGVFVGGGLLYLAVTVGFQAALAIIAVVSLVPLAVLFRQQQRKEEMPDPRQRS